MLTPKGRVKILDFGLARLRSEQAQTGRLTRDGAFMGTPEYVAPEQATDARKADIRADIYSMGCTLYCLLAGNPPFAGDTPLMLVLAHLGQEVPPLQEARADVLAELAGVVARMLAKAPAARFQTPVEVARALEPFVHSKALAGPARETTAGSRRSKLPGADKRVTMRAAGSLLKEHTQPLIARGPIPGKRRLGLLVGAAMTSLVVVILAVALRNGKAEALKVEPRPEPPAERTPVEKWFAVGTRWEGTAALTQPNASAPWAWWFTVRSRDGNKFKGRLVGEGRLDLAIEGTLEDDGSSFRWNTVRHVPNVWSPEQPSFESFECSGKCLAERGRLDWKWPKPDGQVVEGWAEFTVRKDGPQKDDEEAWPPPLFPRRARTGPAGKWSVQDGELVQEEFIADANKTPFIHFGELAWKDYDFHFQAMRTAGDQGFIVVFDMLRSVKQTQWCIGLAENRITYVETYEILLTGSKLTPLCEQKPAAIADNQWYNILIQTRGQRIECFLDGASVFRIAHPDRWGGKVGFACLRMAGRFKDIEVKAPDGKVLWEGLPELPE